MRRGTVLRPQFESGASPELYEGEDAQISDATCETALLHDKSLPSSGTFPSACSTPDNAQYREPVFRADVSQGGKGFQLFQLCRLPAAAVRLFRCRARGAFEPQHPDGSGDRFRACAMMTRVICNRRNAAF